MPAICPISRRTASRASWKTQSTTACPTSASPTNSRRRSARARPRSPASPRRPALRLPPGDRLSGDVFEQLAGGRRDLLHRPLEWLFVPLGGRPVAAHLAHELERGRPHFLLARRLVPAPQ